MIPLFPKFKPLGLADKAEVDSLTRSFPPYSDFEFASLWSWNVKEEMALSVLHDNLVIKFTDYTTGEPFLTFLGLTRVQETAEALLADDPLVRGAACLRLVPEISVLGLDPAAFLIEELRDHFDYVCDIQRHIAYSSPDLKRHRRLLKQFAELHPAVERVSLNLASAEVQREIAELFKRWDANKGFLTANEAVAYRRFVVAAPELSHSAVGLRVSGTLAAFHVVSLPPGGCANALFAKADVGHRGIYSMLDHVVAQDLIERGYSQMNIQQDLGIESLRAAKTSLHPSRLLKKYSVRARNWRASFSA